MALLAGMFTALAVFMLIVFATRSRRMPENVHARFQQLERGSEMGRDDLLALPFSVRVGTPLSRGVRRIGAAILPAGVIAGTSQRLMLAGAPMTVRAFFTFQAVMLGVSVVLLALFLTSGSSGWLLLTQVAGAVLLALLPSYWLRIKVAARKRTILRALPDAVDLMVTTVEAGMGIDGALSAVGNETPGPLGDELRATVRETTLGQSRREALIRVQHRTQVPELSSFLQALIQAEQTGIPIGQVLRIQADEMRLRRRQMAEAAAQRAPVKMILVVVLLVLPAMLLFVMGPAWMRMRDAL